MGGEEAAAAAAAVLRVTVVLLVTKGGLGEAAVAAAAEEEEEELVEDPATVFPLRVVLPILVCVFSWLGCLYIMASVTRDQSWVSLTHTLGLSKRKNRL